MSSHDDVRGQARQLKALGAGPFVCAHMTGPNWVENAEPEDVRIFSTPFLYELAKKDPIIKIIAGCCLANC